MSGTIIGFDQDLPVFDSKFDTAAEAYELIKQMLLAEQSVTCSLGEALLLADAPPSMLSGISKQIIDYSKVDNNPLRAIATLYLLLQADGIKALQEIEIPDFNKTLEPVHGIARFDRATYRCARHLMGRIMWWVYAHVSEENYCQFAKFAEGQSGELAEQTLIAMRPYASMSNYQSVLGILEKRSDLNVKYSVITNLCVAFGEPVFGIDCMKAHSKELTDYWTRRVAESKIQCGE